MKKLFFAVAALVAMTSCDWFGHKTAEKCDNMDELQKAVTEASTDTARFDLNGDGNVDSLDIEFFQTKAQETPEPDSAATAAEQAQPENAGEEPVAPAEEPAK